MEELCAYPSKPQSDPSETDIVTDTGRPLALDRKTRSNHVSTPRAKVPKQPLHTSMVDDKYDLALQVKNKNHE